MQAKQQGKRAVLLGPLWAAYSMRARRQAGLACEQYGQMAVAAVRAPHLCCRCGRGACGVEGPLEWVEGAVGVQ